MAFDKRKKYGIALIAGATACVIVLLGVLIAGWLLFGGDSASGLAGGTEVELAIRNGGKDDGILTPPEHGSPATPYADDRGEAPASGPVSTIGPDGLVMPSVTAAAFSGAPLAATEKISIRATLPALLEHKGDLALPRIAEDGRMAWRVYSRPFVNRDDRPRVAVIVMGLGLSPIATEAAIRRLPPPVTLAFHPNAENLERWADMARRAGHEFLLSLPMEPVDFPFEDPGPEALLTVLDTNENILRLERILGRLTGFAGVISVMGSKFSQREDSLRPVLEALNARGLMFVEGGADSRSLAPEIATEIGLPRVLVDIVLDDEPSRAAIDRQLAQLEAIARERAVAVGVARPYPVFIASLSQWAAALKDKKLVLAPVSALVDRQSPP